MSSPSTSRGAGPSRGGRRPRRRTLLALITTHVVLSVGLLGDSAGFLAVAIRRATSADQAFRQAARDMLAMFALYFGIPLSFLALLSGGTLALVTKWRLFRYPWVAIKIALILSVILVGSTVISPVILPGAEPNDAALIAGAAWDVVALTVAATLGVFKPGRPWRRAGT